MGKRPFRCRACGWRGWGVDDQNNFTEQEMRHAAQVVAADVALTRGEDRRLEFNLDVLDSDDVRGPSRPGKIAGDDMKRAFDVCVAAIALVMLSPVLVVIAAAIKLRSTGPLLYFGPHIDGTVCPSGCASSGRWSFNADKNRRTVHLRRAMPRIDARRSV